MIPAGVVPLLVLWDVDHTLIENGGVSKETYAAAFELLTGRSVRVSPETDGRTDPVIMRDFLRANGVEPTEEHLARLHDVLVTAMAAKASRLRERGHALPGAREALAALREVPGVVQSVLTGNIRPNAFTKLAAFGLHAYVDFEVGGYGSDDAVRANLVGIAREKAAAKYGIVFDESTTVLLGDTLRDVQAGRDGGAYVVGVATGKTSVAELEAAGADVVLADLRDTSAVVAAVLGVRGKAARASVLGE